MGSGLLTRRRLIEGSVALVGLGLLGGCGIAPPWAQPARKIPRIGVLLAIVESPTGEFLRRGPAELGYVEGRNLLIEWRADEGSAERIARNAAELVNLNLDLIVANGTERAVAVKQATSTIPIVMTSGTNPIGAGLIESFARPGGNVTGHLESHPQLASRQLELLREIAPGVTHVTALGYSQADARDEELAIAAPALGLQLRIVKTPTAEALEDALAREAGERTDALLVLHSGSMTIQQAKLFEFAARKRVPSMYGRRTYAEAGGLAAYGPNLQEVFSRTAEYVDKILRGARPAELPVQQPSRFDFAINLNTARSLGLTIPPSVLQQATEIIQLEPGPLSPRASVPFAARQSRLDRAFVYRVCSGHRAPVRARSEELDRGATSDPPSRVEHNKRQVGRAVVAAPARPPAGSDQGSSRGHVGIVIAPATAANHGHHRHAQNVGRLGHLGHLRPADRPRYPSPARTPISRPAARHDADQMLSRHR